VYKKFFKLIKNYIFFEVKKFLESLIFGVSKKWLSKIEKVNFLAKIWLNFGEFNEDALLQPPSNFFLSFFFSFIAPFSLLSSLSFISFEKNIISLDKFLNHIQ
jgi:hypothetical protein